MSGLLSPYRRRICQAMGIPVWMPRGQQPAVTQAAAVTPTWDSLRNQIAACQQCSLHKTRTQTVMGQGDKQARLVVIGEAPGADEDRQGLAFIGRAGQLLTKMLAAINLPREDVYITNILKCRPPGNRDPQPDEISQCLPYLWQQLAWIQPQVILLLGRIAAHTLLETDAPMRRLREQTFHFGPDKTPVVVTYHPAYLLRNAEQKRAAWEDLQRVQHMLRPEANTG